MADHFQSPDLPRLAERVERSMWLSISHKLVTVVGVPLAAWISLQAYGAFNDLSVSVRALNLRLERIDQRLATLDRDGEARNTRIAFLDQTKASREEVADVRERVASVEEYLRGGQR